MLPSGIVDVAEGGHGSSATGLRALLFAGLGILFMAIVAATPGSPYQPLLTPRGQPRGILRDVAVALHLDRLQGDPLLAIGVVATLLATAAFLLLLREAFRGTVSVRAVAVVVVGAHALLLLVPLLFSRDVYSYAFYGRIAGIYGGNPYVQTPLDHSSDLLWNFVGPQWVDTPAYYGPAWTSFSALLSRVLPRPIDHVEAYRFVAIAASLSTCGVIVWIVQRLRPTRTAFALAAFGANPVVLFHAVASGHNDLVVALAIVCAFALLVSERESAAVAVLTLAVLIKVTAALPLILLLVWCVARRPQGQRGRALLSRVGLSGAIGVLFALPYLQLRDPTLGMLGLAGQTGWLAPPTVVARAIDAVTFHTLGWTIRLAAVGLLAWCIWSLGRAVWQRASTGDTAAREQAGVWGWALVLLLLLGPILIPWYVVWGLPLVWALPRVPRTAMLAASSMLGVTLWSAEALRYPGAFELNLFVGYLVVVPVLLVLLVLVVGDLRSRVEFGRSFEDQASTPAASELADEPRDEERVPDPAGDAAGHPGDPPPIEIGAEAF
jgi:alpha-1,6-mannosyltransferase